MELSRQAPAPARYLGIGIVVAVHVAAITALSLGFIHPPAKPKDPTVLLPPLPKTPEPPPPREPPIRAAQPVVTPVPVPPLPVPAEPTITPDPVIFDPMPRSQPAEGFTATGPTTVAQPSVMRPPTSVQSPGAVCSVMPRPDVPAVSWSGEAVLNVIATVRGGRVVGTEFRVSQGALDGKSRRALQRAVESALAGYQCQGDATFQQDFAFRLE
ncbi:MAG: hypothetical protein V3V71_05730 [Roseateles sp.]|jgi:hypothetical protein|nr:hypothetical protein [Methylibium sp.]MBY0367996.1 hypothetical protein [Burkholderiaceae bacterium]MCH8181321.1 hypothetical protein [Pseudomonadota bacterium]RTL17536.1 MAG: hypothetical protein EKK52_16320 [Burkholderiales bacterium]|mmetsp:Transcript_12686/g.23495  ORF Transcript_12686/g.23495 Transcript_12686/m.23495 type:complete len:213 (-) Transcript_12686:358-996(-)